MPNDVMNVETIAGPCQDLRGQVGLPSANVWSAAANALKTCNSGPAVEPISLRSPVPLSYAQERLWFLDRARPKSPAYNIPFAWKIRGPLSIPALETALNRIAQRHTILQSRYAFINGAPVQLGGTPAPIVVTRDLLWLDEFTRQPFNLESAPLIAANVIVCGDEEFYLALVVHHIVFDGWSKGILLRELNAEYAAVLRGRRADIREPMAQYADYAVWHRRWLGEGVVEEEAAYWRDKLGGLASRTTLQTDRPRAAASPGQGAALFFSLPPPLYLKVEQLRKQMMTTRYVVLLAALKALLHRYTGHEDIVVGSVAANRIRKEFHDTIGCFVNPLPLRTAVPGNVTFQELLCEVEKTARGAFAHQEMPFDRLVSDLNPERALNRTPFFDVMFALENTRHATLQLAGTRARPIPVHNGCAKFDLSVELSEAPGRITAAIEYDTALFDRSMIHSLARHFSNLLENAVDHPTARISDLRLLGDKEERQLVRGWNQTATEYPRHAPVHALFSVVAARSPAGIALEEEGRRWSYEELDRRSDAIASALQEHGVARGTIVAVAAVREARTVAALLGVLKAGGAYIPIEPGAPVLRNRALMQDCGARIILAPRDFVRALSRLETDVLCIDDLASAPARRGFVAAACGPEAVAYVLYTSGSTGKPKGVCVPHRGIVRLVRNTNYIQLGPADVIAQAASLAFDAATFEIWGALLNGARLFFIPQDIVLEPRRLAEVLENGKITTLFLTTSLFNLVSAQAPNAFRAVRTVLFGGEAADVNAVRRVLAHGRPDRLLNVYGPTETTTFATFHEISEVPPGATSIPIGRPISNTEVHLLDGSMRVVPPGVRGEVYVSGDGVALGYVRRPTLTAQRFVQVGADGGTVRGLMYRTGDFAVRRTDGVLEFAGRGDDQVKIRGFRVEPREIEQALRDHCDVSQACVLAQDSIRGKELVAYVVPRESGLKARHLRERLSARLPAYMVPASFVLLARLPLNTNGKVDRSALPTVEPCDAEQPAAEPWIPLHLQLKTVWEQLLGKTDIHVGDNFFELGGHSLLAVQLMERIEDTCGKRLPVAALFEHPTIETLARAIVDLPGKASPIIEVESRGAGTPVYFLHGDLWGGGLYCRDLALQLGPEQPFYAVAPQPYVAGAALPRIAMMARYHLKCIKERQPHGPYVLGGFCVSALVALEMARSLVMDGERVELLAMVDPPEPAALRWLRRGIEVTSQFRGSGEHTQAAHFFRRFRQVYRARELWSQGAREKLAWLKTLWRHRAPAGASCGEPAIDVAAAYLWATAGFQPPRYNGPTALICCDAVMGSADARIRHWRHFLPNVKAHTIDCAHLELVTTCSGELARILRSALANSPATVAELESFSAGTSSFPATQ